MTGFDDSSGTARAITDGLRSLVRAERVVVTNDAVTSYLGAIGFEPGAVTAAGTGAVALAGDMGGSFARSDGWGYMLGDDGGGYYVGRRGLANALRAYDGRGGSEALKRRAEKRLGPLELIKQRVYGASNPVSEVASFAQEVAPRQPAKAMPWPRRSGRMPRGRWLRPWWHRCARSSIPALR